MPLHRLIYTSVPVAPTQAVVDDILATSRHNNARDSLTGMLVFTSDYFVQIIEGPCQILSERFIIIGNDRRHAKVNIRSFQPVDERLFSEWDMKYFSHDSASLEKCKRFFSGKTFEPAKMNCQSLEMMCMAIASQPVLGVAA